MSASKAKFAHLHCHSEYSKLDGGSRVDDMPEVLDELGFKHMALTDHGVMQGLPHFYDTLTAAGIKPILGLEAYLTEDRHNRNQKKTPTWHLTLLAESDEGYRNLCKISSWAFIDGRVMTFGNPRPRADWELLERYSEGIICLTGCMAGPVMSEIMSRGDISKARERTERLIEIFGAENVYGELQNVGISTGIPGDSEAAQLLGKEPLTAAEAAAASTDKDPISAGQVTISQNEANRLLVEEICRPLGLAYVGTGDVHYLRADDADPHDTMICIGTHQVKNGQRKFGLLPSMYHLRSHEEMLEALAEWPECLEETVAVAERCQAQIDYGRELLPRYPIPEGEPQEPGEYLAQLCQQGLDQLYPAASHPRRAEAEERLAMELGVIGSMGFNDYFLIVWDLFREARERNIPYGPGRGSAAGSLVAYVLGITQICPLENGLLFERFLNPDRKSMPDIDMDFGVEEVGGRPRRDELIDYATEMYNDQAGCQTAVTQIVTFGKFKAKGALRDAARALAEPSEEGRVAAQRAGDRLAGLIPDDPRATMKSVWKDENEGQALRAAFHGDPFDQAVIKQAGWMEGLVRTYGTHAAAVIIADHDLTNDLPLQQMHDDKPLEVQYDMGISERLGLLKMDFLGLKTLDVIWKAVALVQENRGVEINDVYRDIPLDDQATYDLLAAGKSIGVFQFESEGMSSALRQIKPTEFNDLVAIVALYRPGPMVHIPTYAARKQGREEVEYLDERLRDILGPTYGITVFQEQSMIIARQLAGFTPGQADDLRKAIGKKLKDKMDALRAPYLQGCQENGVSKATAEALWADNEAAADYSFNKSHAACYALIAYITAYLKANFPEEYWAALMTSVISNKDKLRLFLTDAKSQGVKVLPPDINRSVEDFAVVQEEEGQEFEVLFGLTAITGVNSQVVEQLLAEREQRGPFTSLFDIVRRQPKLSAKVLQSLAQGGALDNLPGSRRGQSEIAEQAVEENKQRQKEAEKEYRQAVKLWLQEHPEPGQETTSKGLRKFSALETAGITKGSTYLFKNQGQANDDQLLPTLIDAVSRKRLSDERRKAKQELGEGAEAVRSIASEDQDSEDPIEALAQQRATAGASEDQQLAERLETELRTAAQAVAAAQAQEAHQEALLAASDPLISEEEWEYGEKILIERSKLGIYVTGHPLDPHKKEWAYYVDKGLGQIDHRHIGQRLKVAGALSEVQVIRTRRGGMMGKVTVDDLTGSRTVTIWPDDYQGIKDLLTEGQLLVFKVQVKKDHFAQSQQDEGSEDVPVQLFASQAFVFRPEEVEIPENIPDAGNRATIYIEQADQETIERLKEITSANPGATRLFVKIGEDDPVRTSLTFANEPHVFELLEQVGQVRGQKALG